MSNILELSVSELSGGIKRLIEESFGYVRVRGEISGFRGASPSGHVYFRMKDESAVIEAVIWKGAFAKMKFKPAEGLEMIATGKVTTFPGSSKYQIVIENLEPAGAGALMAILEERRARLTKEGLFDAARKKPLPYLPVTIGVITSPTGAVIRDILHRLADRFPRDVIIWPVRVQGDEAAGEITRAINGFQTYEPRPDLLIVARGGGSLEDLWCFNEENVVRAAANSTIPLISAVGHETDTTLIDFASDKRAPTPTAAAEMAVPVKRELEQAVFALNMRSLEAMSRAGAQRRLALTSAARGLPTAERLLSMISQRLDMASTRLPLALKALAQRGRTRYVSLEGKLSTSLLNLRLKQAKERLLGLSTRHKTVLSTLIKAESVKIERQKEQVSRLFERQTRALTVLITRRKERLTSLTSLINVLSYKSVLARGFALVRDDKDRPLQSASSVKPASRIVLEFADGKIEAVAGGVKKAKEKPVQESLF